MLEDFNPILWIFASYGLGALATGMLDRFGAKGWFENHNYLGDKLTKRIGVLHLGWLIRKSFMGKFNPNIKFKGGRNKAKLEQLKNEMTLAEMGHLIAFVLLQIFIVVLAFKGIETWQIVAYTILNFIFNLYLVFLQQFNKRRIDKLLNFRGQEK